MRNHFVATESDYRRRVQKLFETANVKIDSVVSDLFGVSGRNLMNLILTVATEKIQLEDVQACLRGHLTPKGQELFDAIQGFVTDHHRFLLNEYLNLIDGCRKTVKLIEEKIADMLKPHQPIHCRISRTDTRRETGNMINGEQITNKEWY